MGLADDLEGESKEKTGLARTLLNPPGEPACAAQAEDGRCGRGLNASGLEGRCGGGELKAQLLRGPSFRGHEGGLRRRLPRPATPGEGGSTMDSRKAVRGAAV